MELKQKGILFGCIAFYILLLAFGILLLNSEVLSLNIVSIVASWIFFFIIVVILMGIGYRNIDISNKIPSIASGFTIIILFFISVLSNSIWVIPFLINSILGIIGIIGSFSKRRDGESL